MKLLGHRRIGRNMVKILRKHASTGVIPHFACMDAGKDRMQDLVVVIPSYARPEKICHTTLSLLRRHGVPLDSN